MAAGAALILGVNGHSARDWGSYAAVPLAKQFELIGLTGAKWYRLDWPARSVGGRTDEILAKAQSIGVTVLPILFPNIDLSKETDPAVIYRKAYEDGKRNAANLRGKIRVWELSNELDNYAILHKGDVVDGKEWTGGSPNGDNASDYDAKRFDRAAALLKGLSEGIRAGNKDAIRIINAAGWKHFGFVRRLLQSGVEFEIVGWHWYSEMGDISNAAGTDVLMELRNLRKPIWITEGNYRFSEKRGIDVDRAAAKYLHSTLNLFSKNPNIEAYFVYELLDEPEFLDSPESQYGLLSWQKRDGKLSFTEKPSFKVFADAAHEVLDIKAK